jgi:hypothetical protein
MFGLFKHYLKRLRAKKLRRQQIFKAYFKGIWMKKFRRQNALRDLLNKREIREKGEERLKY